MPVEPTVSLNGLQHATGSNAKLEQTPEGVLVKGMEGEPSLEELESQLPVVQDGQVPLGELISRMVQTIYAELTEMAETLPGMSDAARKRTMADWVVKTKKQVVKLYAVVKWARDAQDVQKAMNITAFLMDQNRQFEEAVQGVTYAKESLAPARLRNHDLLTSLDVLTTGSYLRLPSVIKKHFIPPTSLSDAEVARTLKDMEDTIRFRLRIAEIIPVEMSHYRIHDGRVHFVVPELFQTSVSLRGAKKDDGWLFVHVEFLHDVGGDSTGIQDFPREPTGVLKQHIAIEADGRLAYYLPLPEDTPPPPPGIEPPPRPQLSSGTVDAPLIRLFNFLQMMSFSYQLEILFFQSQRMRSLGWADHLKVEKSTDGKSFTASYWIRPNPNFSSRPSQPSLNRPNLPLLGGTVIISIIETHSSGRAGAGPSRVPKGRFLAELQERGKIGDRRLSDVVESLQFAVKWEPAKGALGVAIPSEYEVLAEGELKVDSQNLDFEAILVTAIRKHIRGILSVFQHTLQTGPSRAIFSAPNEVAFVSNDNSLSLHVHLCAEEFIVVFIDPRTGRLTLRDTGELAAAGRGPRDAVVSDKLNESPSMIYEALIRLRYNTITELAEQKAIYLGLQTFRTRNFSREEAAKWGPAVRGHLFIQLANFPNHYLVLVITDEEFRFALISVHELADSPHGNMIMEDIGWLDVRRVHGDQIMISDKPPPMGSGLNHKDNLLEFGSTFGTRSDRFRLESDVLRELYAYCCARVAYTKVEMQLKQRHIPSTWVNPGADLSLPASLPFIQSTLTRSLPTLCVQSSDILAGAPAAEAAMPNIRVFPLNWWSTKQTQVVTCVKLKYVQQPIGNRAGTSTVIRPSKRIIYDTRDAVVSFLSESVDTCVDEFLEEWAKVSKMVVIAREVAQMPKVRSWDDVRLLSFDLQTVEFAYARDYTVSITCKDQLIPSNSTYEIQFSRSGSGTEKAEVLRNPHEDAEPFFRNVLQHGRLRTSLLDLVLLLRITLPVVVELDALRNDAIRNNENIDVFAKAAGWYRLLHGDLRHALDFRLLTGNRIAIFDASYIFAPPSLRSHTTENGSGSSPGKSSITSSAQKSSVQSKSLENQLDLALFQPIPDFHGMLLETITHASLEGAAGPIAEAEVGLVCSVDDVPFVVQHLHAQVLSRLKGLTTAGT